MLLTGNLPRIERMTMTRFTWRIMLLAGFAWFIESLSIGSLGVILEPIKQFMHLSPQETGILTSSSTFGIVLGLIPAGYLADRLGRKQILVWGIVFYSLFTLFCSLSTNFEMLVFLRFLSGVGMGAVFPLPYAIVSELVGSRQRTLISGFMDAFLSVGYFLAPLLGLLILPNFPAAVAWRVFFACSALPIFYALVIQIFLPESPGWLAQQGRQAQARVSVVSPWKKPYLRRTLSRSAAAAGTFFMFYIVMTYMPTLFSLKGFTFAHSLLYTAIITAAAIPGKIVNGYLAERMGRKPVFIMFMGLAGIGCLFFGLAVTPFSMLFFASIISFCGTGAFPALKMSYAEQYPTSFRTTGAATVETAGRFFGGTIGSYAMPVILSAYGMAVGFYLVTLVAFGALLVEAAFSLETKTNNFKQLESGALRQGDKVEEQSSF